MVAVVFFELWLSTRRIFPIKRAHRGKFPSQLVVQCFLSAPRHSCAIPCPCLACPASKQADARQRDWRITVAHVTAPSRSHKSWLSHSKSSQGLLDAAHRESCSSEPLNETWFSLKQAYRQHLFLCATRANMISIVITLPNSAELCSFLSSDKMRRASCELKDAHYMGRRNIEC